MKCTPDFYKKFGSMVTNFATFLRRKNTHFLLLCTFFRHYCAYIFFGRGSHRLPCFRVTPLGFQCAAKSRRDDSK